MLREKGYFLIKYKLEKKFVDIMFHRKANLKDISILCNNLSQMTASGLPMHEIFNIIGTENKKGIITESMCKVERSIERGETIYESIKKFSHIYPLFMIQMIKIGEVSGKLEMIFKYLSEYYDKKQKLSNKIKCAISYPLMVLITSIFVVMFLMTKIIPEFINTLSNTGGSIPTITSTILCFFTFFKEKLFFINLTLSIFIFVLYKFSRTYRGKIYFHKLKLNLPIFGEMYNKFLFAEFTKSLAILISAGISIIKALDICLSIMQNKVLEEKLHDAIENIKKGESIYISFKKQKLGNGTFLNLVRIGEECGTLEAMLFKISNIFEYEVEDSLKKAVNFIEPITILVLAIFIGIFVVGALLPIFNIMDSIG